MKTTDSKLHSLEAEEDKGKFYNLAEAVKKLEQSKAKLLDEVYSQSLLIERLYEEKLKLEQQLEDCNKKLKGESVTLMFDPKTSGKRIMLELELHL